MIFQEVKENKKLKFLIKITLYALSAILVIFYFAVLILSITKTDVSWEYKMYYITDEADVWVRKKWI